MVEDDTTATKLADRFAAAFKEASKDYNEENHACGVKETISPSEYFRKLFNESIDGNYEMYEKLEIHGFLTTPEKTPIMAWCKLHDFDKYLLDDFGKRYSFVNRMSDGSVSLEIFDWKELSG